MLGGDNLDQYILEKISKDKSLVCMLENITDSSIIEFDCKVDEINKILFSIFCQKSYLNECEPEYCSFRFTSQCLYIKALELVKQKYGIDVINKRLI